MKYRNLLAVCASAVIATSALAQETIKMSTVAPGTAVYRTMTTIASIINQKQDKYSIVVDATGAVTKQVIEVAQGKVDICMISPLIYQFLEGQKAMYKNIKNGPELAGNLRLLLLYPYGEVHIITQADSGIKTLADIKGKKVFLGPPGGAAWQSSYDWLKDIAGLDLNNGDYESIKASWGSALQGFQDGQIDVYFVGAISPAPSVEQLALTSKIRLIGVTPDEYESNPAVKAFYEKYPPREYAVIKKGIYGDNVLMDEDNITIGTKIGLVVNADLDDEAVYTMVKAFWDNVGEASETLKWLKQLTLEYALSDATIKLHPGALRYYEEIGANIPEALR